MSTTTASAAANPTATMSATSASNILPVVTTDLNPAAITIAPDTASTTNSKTAKTMSLPLRFVSGLIDLLARPQPVGRHLRRRDRAVRYYKRQVRSRIRLHQAVMIACILTCVVCVVLTWAFFSTDLIRPHCAPNTPFAGITVIIAVFSVAVAIYAYTQLRGISKEAYRFAQFYLDSTNDDGTINVDPSSDHDYGDRVMNGRVYVRMSDIYKWFCKDD